MVASSCSSIGIGLGGGSSSSTVTVTVSANHPGNPINKSLLGADGPAPSQYSSEVKALGLRYIRTDVSFEGSVNGQPVYNCSTGAWNPALLDGRVNAIHAQGAQPELIIDYTPPCLAPAGVVKWCKYEGSSLDVNDGLGVGEGFWDGQSLEPSSYPCGVNLPPSGNATWTAPDVGSANQAKWDALVAQMATHEIQAEGVRVFEVWNEPDGRFLPGGPASLPAYLHLYQDTATVLESVANKLGVQIQIGGPATMFADPVYIPAFLAFVAAHHLPLSFISWHWYADSPLAGPYGSMPSSNSRWWYNPALSTSSYASSVAQVKGWLKLFPSLHPKLWIDEWNVDAGYDPRQQGPYGAAFVASALSQMQAAGLNRACFFNLWNSANWADFGLLTPGGNPVPAYYSMLYWHELASSQVPVDISSQLLATSKVGAVASTGSNGQVTILSWNFLPYSLSGNYGTSDPTPYDHVVKVVVNGLVSGARYSWTRALVDGAHPSGGVVASGTLSGPSASMSFTLPGEGVSLITLNRNG